MIEARPLTALAALAARFPGPQLDITITSILAGNTAARLWAGDDFVLLWDQGNNVLYLAETGATHPTHLTDLISGPIRDAALIRGRPYFRARALMLEAEAALRDAFASVQLHPVRKRFYRYAAPAPGPLPEPDGVAFLPIDGSLLRTAGLANLDLVKREIGFMWPSEERFCRRGLGVAALVDRAIAGWCTAEYVGPRACGIGIETPEPFQRRGIAAAAARRLIRLTLARGLTPHWECDAENLPSVRLAEKLGFTLLEETTFWAGLF
jgi:RimJ/RimL family protein N-acetyltransferase